MPKKKTKRHRKQHKYLNDIQINSDEPFVFATAAKSKPRREKHFTKQQEKYGFDERETWAFNYTMITWLYSHIKWILEHDVIKNQVRLVKIKTLEKIPKNELEHVKGEKYPRNYFRTRKQKVSLRQALETATEYMEEYLYSYNSFDRDNIIQANEYAQAAIEITAMVFPYLS